MLYCGSGMCAVYNINDAFLEKLTMYLHCSSTEVHTMNRSYLHIQMIDNSVRLD